MYTAGKDYTKLDNKWAVFEAFYDQLSDWVKAPKEEKWKIRMILKTRLSTKLKISILYFSLSRDAFAI